MESKENEGGTSPTHKQEGRGGAGAMRTLGEERLGRSRQNRTARNPAVGQHRHLVDAHNDGANEDDPSPSCGSEPQPREERYDRDKEGTNRDGGEVSRRTVE